MVAVLLNIMIVRRALAVARQSLLASRSATVSRVHSKLSTVVPSKPIYYHSFGIPKVLLISTPFIYAGAFLAKSFALYLEDFDLFVPDDDDD